jgi:hypothetical protein
MTSPPRGIIFTQKIADSFFNWVEKQMYSIYQ